MKRNYKTLVVGGLMALSFSMKSQVSLYTFSQLSGTYTSVSGGTVFGTNGSDDQVYLDPGSPNTNANTGVGIPIGFNFTYDNIVFDRFGINNNGWIGLGQSTLTPNPVDMSNSGSNYNGISSASGAPALNQYRVAGLSRDLQGNGSTSELRVETIGTTPNQVCVIQFSSYKKFGTNGTGDDFTFQFRLYETTNRIEVVYGTFISNANAGTAEVGLRGASNADFNNRITNGSSAWNVSVPGTVNTSVVNYNSSGLTPNSGQIYRWDVPVPCSGAPTSNTVTSLFSTICPNAGTSLGLTNTYSNTGISYQWYVSTSSGVGPFTVVPTATNAIYAPTGIAATSWYQAVITCSAGPVSSTATPVNVMIAGTTTNSVPYYEGFEGIVQNNQFPNCSWSASSPTTINQTYLTANVNNRIPHSGQKFASFRNNTSATGDYFYSNGIQLEPGITYSAAVWYITDGNLGWSEFSMSYNTSQSNVGLTSIASVTGAVIGQNYQLLSNTFTVPNSGLYYIAIKCIGSSVPQFLSWDDLSITIPCSLNSPTMNVITTPTLVCIGQPLTIIANGADTYTWSTGDQNASITYTPFNNGGLNVMGTNSLTGCSVTVTPMLMPNASPVVSIFSNSQSVCLGSSITLNAVGANSYTWSSGSNANSTTVAPTTATTYTVLGSNAIGCVGSSTITMGVNQLPQVIASSNPSDEMCANETATLTGNGALTYQWKNNSIIILTQEAYVSPQSSTVYTLTGTDANGCSASVQLVMAVSPCTGVNELTSTLKDLSVYPNPANSNFTIELGNGLNKQIDLIDVSGRVVMTSNSSDDKINVNIHQLAAGIYYVKVTSGNATEVIKLVKN
jgi:hypothetical protein